jgi:hypothetical protein
MFCNCNIQIGYTLSFESLIVRDLFSIFPTGEENGYYYYTWLEPFDETPQLMKLYFNSTENRWEVIYDGAPEITIAYLDTFTINKTNPICPYDENITWVVTDPDEVFTSLETLTNNCSIIKTEEQECFEVLVWDKQCCFSQEVLKYLQTVML